jgi:hypothetical protein
MLKRHVDQAAEYRGLDQFTQQAFDVILGSGAKAFPGRPSAARHVGQSPVGDYWRLR